MPVTKKKKEFFFMDMPWSYGILERLLDANNFWQMVNVCEDT